MEYGFCRAAGRLLLFASATAIMSTSAAIAQTSQGEAGRADSTSTTEGEGAFDIVVTAQRRSELSRDVPISIVSLSGDQLVRSNINQLGDISKLTPGVRFRGSSNFQQPSIRGVSTALVGSGVGSNVGIYVDGFYSSTAAGSNFQLMNVRDIQVLKGPQGTLFGRNTTGGAILVSTARPSAEPSALIEGDDACPAFDGEEDRRQFCSR